MNDSDVSKREGTLLPISDEQEKLLQSALRIKIMHALAGDPLTSKQVAERLGKTPGNVHYHIQKLFEGGLLELVRTEAAGGIMQKFYRSKATWFRSPNFSGFGFRKEDTALHFTTRLSLSAEELTLFRQDVMKLIGEWEAKATHGEEYGVEMIIGRLLHPTDSGDSNGGERHDAP
ncbi:Helix-turn-helix domain-containing protein [Paenibacillus sophorae]|uniref:Helix-turn-helix domain-containing protein n=1 Tax=Paenibacillus sophorae TaxID=1333845 RepID=A0A1H8SNF2_9BACL|nr:winged helix-turn-helix domain-containing protein [Paenibacillus sophorae]QWU15492.1 helix-turn-helix domain-containing protein [Paenibacillus sophorae]SEO80056.1 Helix-turn-helix domain-containing protein [Paenibacillus sophorae]